MATIALEGMRFFSKIGFYEEERIIGNQFVVDVYIEANTKMAATTDDLSKTINYETVYYICKKEMGMEAKLIENVAERIGLGIRYNFPNISELTIRVQKLNPPLGAPVGQSYYETNANYSKKCGRCQRPMLCYSDATCWCMGPTIHRKTQEQMSIQYGNQCLCADCVAFFSE